MGVIICEVTAKLPQPVELPFVCQALRARGTVRRGRRTPAARLAYQGILSGRPRGLHGRHALFRGFGDRRLAAFLHRAHLVSVCACWTTSEEPGVDAGPLSTDPHVNKLDISFLVEILNGV
jgi:hypothetical protein